MHEFMHLELFLFFCNKHVYSTTLGPKLIFGGFSPFRRRNRPVAETSIGVHLIECFRIVEL